MMNATTEDTGLARRLGLFDVTMIVMGGIIGSGIFMNPSVVAKYVQTPFLILAVWGLGGLVALAGSFIYGELASRMPNVGGQYAYIREAIHPLPAFLYGWALLLVIQSGGMAAVSLTFSRYFLEFVPLGISDGIVAVIILFSNRDQLSWGSRRKYFAVHINGVKSRIDCSFDFLRIVSARC